MDDGVFLAHMATFPPRTYRGEQSTITSQWMNIIIKRYDGDDVSLNIQGTPSLLRHILEESKVTGFLLIWNEAETIAVPRDDIETIKLTKLTKEAADPTPF